MPGQVIPVQDIASAGVIIDTPSVALPPNVFSNVENMRFHDGAARKMTGEEAIYFSDSDIDYISYWQGPNHNYYVIARSTGAIVVYDADDTNDSGLIVGTMSVLGNPEWQHTIFNGGFTFVLNNGVSTPTYLQDAEGLLTITSLAELPNWDSYLVQEVATSVTWDEQNADISLGQRVDFDTHIVIVTITPSSASIPPITARLETADSTPLITLDTSQAFDLITPRMRTDELSGALYGDTVSVAVQTRPAISVTAGVVRAYGNLLVAGDLMEIATEAVGTIAIGDTVRTLPGTIRTSDVAAPGSIPFNWNPFRIGANTADEFVLSGTGKVQDLVELQGVLYVYTTNSIHSIQQTGSPVLPFQIAPVTNSYGADNTGSVIDLDGKHIVVGSNDVYIFAGHPGSISSISDSRVRFTDFFDDGRTVNIVRFQKYDELWFWSPAAPEMFIWNYRDNTWTRRSMSQPVSGNAGPNGPIFATATRGYEVDGDGFILLNLSRYESFLERRRLALAPEFDTETLSSIALMYTGTANLSMQFEGTNAPGNVDEVFVDTFPFLAVSDWKTDVRVQGRFLNYRISDGTSNDQPWNLTGFQLDIAKGGTR